MLGLTKRTTAVLTVREARRAILRMLGVAGGSLLAGTIIRTIGVSAGYGAAVSGLGLLYVIPVGHYASWPKTLSADAYPLRVAVVTGLFLAVVLVLASWIAFQVGGAVATIGVSAIGLLVTCYWTAWWARSLIADAPRLRDARGLIWGALTLCFALIGAYVAGLDVKRAGFGDFYAAITQADATLLVAATLQWTWARRVRAYEGTVLVTAFALVLSLACSLVALGRHHDSADLFALTTVGLASGIYLIGLGGVRQLAPDLLRAWTIRSEENFVSDQLAACNWTVERRRGRRRLRYDLKAVRGSKTIYVAVTSSPVLARPSLTDSQWDRARRVGPSYVLAVVDYFGSEWQCSWFVRDPTATNEMSERSTFPLRLQRPCLERRGVEAAAL